MQKNTWQEFSTDLVHPALRAKRWAEFGSDTLSEMQVSPLDDRHFSARIQRLAMGSLGYAFLESTAAQAKSAATCAGSWGAQNTDCLLMSVADEGNSVLKQGRWSADLRAGDIAIRDLTKPWESHSEEDIKLILIKIPFSKVARHHPDPEQLIGRHLSASQPAVAFASSVIRASRHALQSDPDGDWLDCLNDVLDQVFRLICGQIKPCEIGAPGGNNFNLRREALNLIERNLVDPDLSVGQIAEQMSISTRHLQRLFLSLGVSPRQYILEERLKNAAHKLSQEASRDASRIIDIAFETGFNDASHFSRAFSQRFGCSPRDYRKRALLSGN